MQNGQTTTSVMIIDDSEGDRFLLKRELQSIDYEGEIFEVSNGQEALSLLLFAEKNTSEFKTFPPQVIFLDINMPVMNGYEFLLKLQAIKQDHNRFSSINVMMLSGSYRPADINKSMQFDYVKDFLVKGKIEPAYLKKIVATTH